MELPNLSHRGMKLEPWPTDYDDRYLPAAHQDSWCPELEKAPPEARERVILFKLKNILAWAWQTSPFYRRKWEAAGVHPEMVRSLEDFAKFPVVN